MFKEGQKWRCRSGQHVVITRIYANGAILGEDGYSRHPNGKRGQGGDSPLDLMELIEGNGKPVVFPKFTVEQVLKPTGESVEAPSIKVGQVWECRNGTKTRILGIYEDRGLYCDDGHSRFPSGRLDSIRETGLDLIKLHVYAAGEPLETLKFQEPHKWAIPSEMTFKLSGVTSSGGRIIPTYLKMPNPYAAESMDAVGELPPSEIVAPTSKPLSDIEQFRALYDRLVESSKPPAPSIVVKAGGFRMYGINGKPLTDWKMLDGLNDAIEATGYPVYDVIEENFNGLHFNIYEAQSC